MTPKKIIFIHLVNDYSGSPKVLSQVIGTVQSAAFEVELYTAKSEDGFLSDLNILHHNYFYKRFENRYLTLATFALSQAHLFFKLLKYYNKDVIFYVNTMLPFGAGLAGSLLKKPVYYHIHETSLSPAIFKRFLRMIIQKTAYKVFFVSKTLSEIESFPNKPQKILYNFLANDFMRRALQSSYKHLNNSNFTILMACSLKAYKGINEFIDIASYCSTDIDVSFTLILNAEQAEIDDYFNKKILPKNISIVSRQKDIEPFYKNTSLLLNLSRPDQWIETFGLTIIEAMAYGIPVIVPPVGGPTELVNNGIEGFLISSYKVEKIGEIIIKLSQDETRCQSLSMAARSRSRKFNEMRYIEEVISVIYD